MYADGFYAVQAVALAVGIPVRRLEGWVERGVVRPTQPAAGTGRRARFSREDVLRVAMLAEIQRLLGIDFRPGGLGEQLGSSPLTWARLDTVFRLTVDDAEPGQNGPDSPGATGSELRLYVHFNARGQRSLRVTRSTLNQVTKTGAVCLVIQPRQLWQRVQSRLEGADW